MKYWNTGDVVVDSILQTLEGFGTWRSDSDAESTHQLLSGVIQTQEMLPGLVASHFQFPNLIVGNAHFSGSQDYRSDLIHRITSAISKGLETAAADPKLDRDSNPDFSDRPRSRGEEILDALTAFRENRDQYAMLTIVLSVARPLLGVNSSSHGNSLIGSGGMDPHMVVHIALAVATAE